MSFWKESIVYIKKQFNMVDLGKEASRGVLDLGLKNEPLKVDDWNSN